MAASGKMIVSELPRIGATVGVTIGRASVFALLCAAPSFATDAPDYAPTLGLPSIAASQLDVNQPLAVLGKAIFFNTALSDNKRIGCVSCHDPERGFADRNAIALGLNGASGTRNSPSLLNTVFNTSFFLDGRRASLAQQAIDPFLNGREHGFVSEQVLQKSISSDAGYDVLLERAFGDKQVTTERIATALAAFQSTLVSGNSAFDRMRYGGQTNAMNDSAKRGYALFIGAAGCSACHQIGDTSALFSDMRFHARGISPPSQIEQAKRRLDGASEQDLHRLVGEDRDVAALGRYVFSRDERELGAFRTPSLRNVAITAPYMHDGSIKTLTAAVAWEVHHQQRQGLAPALDEADIADITEFLRNLTSADQMASLPTP